MCGRYVSTKSTADLLDEFDAVEVAESDDPVIVPDYNVAPTTSVRTILTRLPRGIESRSESAVDPVRQLRAARWGLVPSWAKDESVGNKMINARAESLADKAAFKRAFAKRRCLVPADGWYEWHRTTDTAGKPAKQPYLMTPGDGRSLALAGLYEFWRPKSTAGESDDTEDSAVQWLLSVTIVTVPAQGELAEIHERMPLVVGQANWSRWLDPSQGGPSELLTPEDEAAREALELRPVSAKVNSVQNNSVDLLTRVEPAEPALELF
ncbi:SOS response-associated peptidase [Jatrophihabitans sp. DSM 45814]